MKILYYKSIRTLFAQILIVQIYFSLGLLMGFVDCKCSVFVSCVGTFFQNQCAEVLSPNSGKGSHSCSGIKVCFYKNILGKIGSSKKSQNSTKVDIRAHMLHLSRQPAGRHTSKPTNRPASNTHQQTSLLTSI